MRTVSWDRRTARQCLKAFIVVVLLAGFANAQGMTATKRGRATPGVPLLLWGKLTPGPYAVGFKAEFRFDRSRTWNAEHDVDGRPIRVEIWYPARAAGSERRLAYGDYIRIAAPKSFLALEHVLEQRDMMLAGLSVAPGRLENLLATKMRAVRDAAPAKGRYPVVFYFGGLNDTTTAGAILAEYLASHGFVVVSVPMLGTTASDPDQHRTQSGLETSLRDVEFAWGLVRGESFADGANIGVIGHSVGAVEAVLFAMRNSDVRAVAALDGTYGFAGTTQVLTGFYGYAPQRMTAALLDLRKAAGEQGTVLDLSALGDFHYAQIARVTVTKIHHSDFASFAMMASVFGLGNDPGYVDPSGWTRATGASQFQQVCRIVGDFFAEHLLRINEAASRMPRDAADAMGGTYALKQGIAPPPAPEQLLGIAVRQGIEAADAVVGHYQQLGLPVDWVVDERLFNALGYDRLSAHRGEEAIAAFRINTYAHPKSANAFDSLADGYAAMSDSESAIQTLQKAIEVVKEDAAFQGSAKDSFISKEQARILQMKTGK